MVVKRVKELHAMTVRDLKQLNMKLIDTIKVPWDFKKMKLPSKRSSRGKVKRQNQFSGFRRANTDRESKKVEVPKFKRDLKPDTKKILNKKNSNDNNNKPKRNMPPINKKNKLPPNPFKK